MKIGRLTFYEEELLIELKKRDLNLGIVNGLLKEFLFKNMEITDDLSKKRAIIDDLDEKKKEIEREFTFLSFIKRKKIDIMAQRWLKTYVNDDNFSIDKLKISQDVENYARTRLISHMPLKFKQDNLIKSVIKWAYLQKKK